MEKNKCIAAAIGRFNIILGFFLIFQLIFLIAVNFLLPTVCVNFELNDTAMFIVRIVINVFMILVSGIIDIGILINIVKLRSIESTKGIPCMIEDIIVTSYSQNHDKKYNVHLLVKEKTTGKLYLAFGKYDISYYNYVYTQGADTLLGIIVARSDGSEVKIGDDVVLYVRRDVNMQVNTASDSLILNGKRISYQHANTEYTSEIFHKTKFVEGAVDIDTKEQNM